MSAVTIQQVAEFYDRVRPHHEGGPGWTLGAVRDFAQERVEACEHECVQSIRDDLEDRRHGAALIGEGEPEVALARESVSLGLELAIEAITSRSPIGPQLAVSAAELRAALEQAVALIRTWHGMGMRGTDEERAWRIYHDQSPEMEPIRRAMRLS